MDTIGKEFLVKFGESSKIIKIKACEEIQTSTVKDVFGISYDEEITIQRYSPEWNDYVDIEEFELKNIPSKTKLKCVQIGLSELKTNTFSSPGTDWQSTETNSPSSLSVSDTSSDKHESLEIESKFSSEKFKFPEHKYSRQLKQLLENEKPLNWGCKHEFLSTVADEIFTQTYYPKSCYISEVARKITECYPYLKEKIGSGYDGWTQSIRDKLKNARRNLDVPLVRWNKRKSVNEDPDLANKRKHKTLKPKGLNWCPDIPIGEDDIFLKAHTATVKLLVQSPNRDLNMIQELMLKTFAFRRQLINECPTVASILLEYPALKLPPIIHEELTRILKKDVYKPFTENLTRYSSSLVDLSRKKKATEETSKVLKQLDEIVSDTEELTPKVLSQYLAIAALQLLPCLLGEDCQEFINVHSEDTSLQDICNKGRTPYIAVVGTIFHPCAVYVIVEGQISVVRESVIDGVYAAFAAFYIFNIQYPKRGPNSWGFIQHVLCNYTDGGTIPKRVVTLRGKM